MNTVTNRMAPQKATVALSRRARLRVLVITVLATYVESLLNAIVELGTQCNMRAQQGWLAFVCTGRIEPCNRDSTASDLIPS